jgi:predicted ArsR family transcriptional regulator
LVVEFKRTAKPAAAPARWRILQALSLGNLETTQLARMLWLPYEVTRRELQWLEADGLVSRSETRVPARHRRSGAPAFSWRLCAPVGEARTANREEVMFT